MIGPITTVIRTSSQMGVCSVMVSMGSVVTVPNMDEKMLSNIRPKLEPRDIAICATGIIASSSMPFIPSECLMRLLGTVLVMRKKGGSVTTYIATVDIVM